MITTVAGGGRYGLSENIPAASAKLNAAGWDRRQRCWRPLRWVRIATASARSRAAVIATVAGNGTAGFSGDNGPALAAQFNAPTGIAVDSNGDLYVADNDNFRVRKISNGVITTVAGNGRLGFSGDGGPATSAQMTSPRTVALDSLGNLYITESGRVRKVSNGVITTVAGNATAGFFGGDYGPATNAGLNAYGIAGTFGRKSLSGRLCK